MSFRSSWTSRFSHLFIGALPKWSHRTLEEVRFHLVFLYGLLTFYELYLRFVVPACNIFIHLGESIPRTLTEFLPLFHKRLRLVPCDVLVSVDFCTNSCVFRTIIEFLYVLNIAFVDFDGLCGSLCADHYDLLFLALWFVRNSSQYEIPCGTTKLRFSGRKVLIALIKDSSSRSSAFRFISLIEDRSSLAGRYVKIPVFLWQVEFWRSMLFGLPFYITYCIYYLIRDSSSVHRIV